MTPAQQLRGALNIWTSHGRSIIGYYNVCVDAEALLTELDRAGDTRLAAAPVTTFHGHAPKPEPVFTAHQLRYLAALLFRDGTDTIRRLMDEAARIEREGGAG